MVILLNTLNTRLEVKAMINLSLSYDEQYEAIKLYDILRDMDFELTDKQQAVFDKIQEAGYN